MNLIRVAIERPTAVIAAVVMVVLFGWVALQTIPIQLTPDVNRPVITVSTAWPGAAPAEVEREIVNRQEDALKGLEGVEAMSSRSRDGRASVTMEFKVGTDMDRALLLVSNRLDRVGGYPAEADEPTLSTAGTEDNAIAWFVLRRLPGNDQPMETYGDFAEDVIRDRLERVPGVSGIRVYGGAEREMQVTIDPAALARYGLTVPDVVATLRAANASVSAGDVDEGKRRYIVRTEGDFDSPADVAEVVLRSQPDDRGGVSRVTVGDIGTVAYGYKDPTSIMRRMGVRSMAMAVTRETGANVIETMEGLRAAVAELDAGVIPDAGLSLRQVYDETVYIESAIDLVNQNIYVGGVLAAAILMLFLRSWRATLVVSLAIPVSVIGSFVAMAAMGRSLNVISLAGIAFAVGMVVDAAIVVLENIYRLRQSGLPAREAAFRGANQVWGAVLVSALTTVLVFVPILVMELEVGQLFRDIAVAISVAVLLSLLVSVTVIPALSRALLQGGRVGTGGVRLPGVDALARGFGTAVDRFVGAVTRHHALALAVVVLVTGLAATATWLLTPKLEYLPTGNRNLVFGVLLPPPGYNLDTTTGIADKVEGAVAHLWLKDDETPPSGGDGPPMMDNFFFVALSNMAFVGASAADPARSRELIPVLQGPIFQEPGTLGFMRQASLFGRGIGGGRSINLDVSGQDLGQILEVALDAFMRLNRVLPREDGNQYRPRPGLELGAPEIRVLPDRLRLADNGVSVQALGMTLDAFNDGLRVDEITVGSERLDLTLLGPGGAARATQDIGDLPVVTAGGTIVPARSLADVVVTAGPTEIRHEERLRTVTLQITPSDDLPLEAAMDVVRDQIIAPLEAEGLPPGVRLRLSGTADKLTETWNHMVLDLAMAVVIVYLVMAVLFESFAYPLIIVISVPLAAAGGVAGLAVVDLLIGQKLDMLTMLGFVILIGIVVNNAILLVHQSLYHRRQEGMTVDAAIAEATRNRLRPIFMSTLTSVVGMLPLVLFPGAGSELYRGLGSVVVGGLTLSAVLTLLVVPPLLSVFMAAIERRHGAVKAAPEG